MTITFRSEIPPRDSVSRRDETLLIEKALLSQQPIAVGWRSTVRHALVKTARVPLLGEVLC